LKRPLLILPDAFSSRTFVSCGILRRLWDRLGGQLDIVFLFALDVCRATYAFDLDYWGEESAGIRVKMERDILTDLPRDTMGRCWRRWVDNWLDERFGYFSLAMRFNLRHGFLLERMRPGHHNPFLDSRRGRPFARSEQLYRSLFKWYYGNNRFVDPGLLTYLAENTSVLITSNLQFRSAQPYLIAARRQGIPILGNVASWDHPVGKGIVFPWGEKYLVQNEYMREVLCRYHHIDYARIAVTGWPQTDIFFKVRGRGEFDLLLASYGLDPRRQCVLVTGNTENNNPREPRFVEKLVAAIGGMEQDLRPNIIFRPHPKDRNWRQRFSVLSGRDGVYLQAASFSDTDVLALLLQHVDCVVTNAGTVLLDSLVNNRPVVCVVYDEGEPGTEDVAAKNVTGHHYIDVMRSGAFVTASTFEEALAGVSRCLSSPHELARQRQAISFKTVGRIDGQAGERLVGIILASIRSQEAS